MKKAISVLLTFFFLSAYAQSGEENALNALKAGVGYTREFPGLSGYTLGRVFTRYEQLLASCRGHETG